MLLKIAITVGLIPIFFCGMLFLVVSVIIYIASNKNVNDFISYVLAYPFNQIGPTYLGGLLVTITSTVLFFFGIHGRTVFEDVYANVFSDTANSIVNNSLFDCFTLIGGVGSTLCLAIAILLFSDSKRKKRISNASMYTMVFNINELIVYGLPITFNPIYIIPFVLTPIINYSIGYLFILSGAIPSISQATSWTAPIFINGYMATGSFVFILVQFLCFILGIAIYTPFVRLDNLMAKRINKEMGKELESYLKQCEEDMLEPQIFSLSNHLEEYAENILYDLENSIKNEMIELSYQPQVKNGKIISVESLLRFNYLKHDNIYLPLVIQIAKEKDLFTDLSKVIVKKAILDYKKILTLCPNMKISVNLDLDILHNKEFLGWLVEYIIVSGLPHNQFGIEVTENSKYIFNEELKEIFEILHNNKINIYMDDFSMGNTSITFLQNTTFDYVKLDGSLVKNIDNERCENIIKSIVDLGKSLNFEVVAEYVETMPQKNKLKELGCEIYQGYLYYKPMEIDELIDILIKNKD